MLKMESFSKEEKKRYKLKKHIKNHLFEYVLDFIGPILLTYIVLYICKAENFVYGIALSFFYSLGKIAYHIYHYNKDYIDTDIK